VLRLIMDTSIRTATNADLEPMIALLREADLVLDGVEEHVGSFIVAERDGRLTGAMGLEVRGADALLRSAVVAPGERGAGTGRALFERLEALARARGVTSLYLLTTTAADYWSRLGFTIVTRDDVPVDVRQSPEFTGACPASATVMARRIAVE
jgi:N-acetylglutamate synthase-like GNAT family acetyltransferase